MHDFMHEIYPAEQRTNGMAIPRQAHVAAIEALGPTPARSISWPISTPRRGPSLQNQPTLCRFALGNTLQADTPGWLVTAVATPVPFSTASQ